jgi:hypothetical protein
MKRNILSYLTGLHHRPQIFLRGFVAGAPLSPLRERSGSDLVRIFRHGAFMMRAATHATRL